MSSLLLFLLWQPALARVSLDLHWYSDHQAEKLQCNDGSPGGFYYRPSTAEEGEDRWIFYLEGGGWCWNVTSCSQRISGNTLFGQKGHLISSSRWSNTKTFTEGIFTMQDSVWSSAHLVFVPYCSSDAHMGDTEQEVPGHGLQQFRGRRMARKAVQQLVGDKEGQSLLFGRTSAGGRGSMVLVDFLQELLHPSTVVRGLHDSGAYQDILPLDPSYYPFGAQCQAAYTMFSPPLSPVCLAAHASAPHHCVCGQYLLPLLLTPSMVIIHQDDSYQLHANTGESPTNWTEEMCQYAQSPYREGMLTTIEDIWDQEEHIVFGAACYMHGLLTQSSWRGLKVGGVSAEEVLLSWLAGERRRAVSTCRGVNCEEGCPPLTAGEHTYC